MKILITGGAGFLGSHLAETLLDRGDTVWVIDNLATGRKKNLKHALENPKFKFIEDDISKPGTIQTLVTEFSPEVVIHAAASYKNPQDWQEDIRSNVLGTGLLVQALMSHPGGLKRLIYFQTSLCYGLKPIEQPITLKHPYFGGTFAGGSSYAITKTAAEQFIDMSGLPFISFRLANMFGPRNISGPLPTFFKKIKNNEACTIFDSRRDFVYVSDLVEVVVKAVDGVGANGFYHISSGEDFSIKEMFQHCLQSMGISDYANVTYKPRTSDDTATILLDPSVTQKQFDWKIRHTLADGVKKAVAWYEENGIDETYTHLKLDPSKKTS